MTENINRSSPPQSSAMPDWKCSFCGILNPAHLLSCRECSKTRVESDDNFFNIIANNEQKTAYPHPALKSRISFSQILNTTQSCVASKYFKWVVLLAMTFVAILILYLSIRNERIKYKIVDVRWERTISDKSKIKGPERVFKLEGRDNSPRWPDPNFAKNNAAAWEKQPKKTEKYTVLAERISAHEKAPNLVTIIPSSEDFESNFRQGTEIKLQLKSDATILPPTRNSSIKKQER